RFDILNTSKVLLRCEGARIRIDNVILTGGQVYYEPLLLWPTAGLHPIGAIEPSSWAGISDAFACPLDVKAVNLFIELQLTSGSVWTWHRIQNLPETQPRAPNVVDATEKATLLP